MPGARWSVDEIQILKKCYSKMTARELHDKYLRNRSVNSIKAKALALGLSSKIRPSRWTAEEVEILRKYYHKISVKELQNKYLRSKSLYSIFWKARYLGLSRKKKMSPWTSNEINILKQHYGEMPAPQLKKMYFPNRTVESIHLKARSLGLSGKAIKFRGMVKGAVTDDEIINKVNEFGVIDIKSLYSYFSDRISYSRFTYRVKQLADEDKLNTVALNIGGKRGSHKFRSITLFDGIMNVIIVYTDSDKLVEYIADRLGLSPSMPSGLKKALTHRFKDLLPPDIAEKLRAIYSW